MGTRNRSLDSDARAAAAGRADHIEPFDESSVAEVLSALGDQARRWSSSQQVCGGSVAPLRIDVLGTQDDV